MSKDIKTILIVLVVATATLNAQDVIRYSQHIIARPTNDSIMLRWAPINYDSWQEGIKHGYIIERIKFYENGIILPPLQWNKEIIGPIFPWNEQAMWEEYMEQDDYVGIAAEVMYGESVEVQAGEESSALHMFNIATEQENKYSFALFAADMSVTAAKACGLYFADHNVVRGEKFLYRIYINSHDTIPRDTAYIFTGPDEYIPLTKPRIEDIEGDDMMAFIAWERLPGRQEYSAFFIERSDNMGESYTLLNKTPLINTSETGLEPDFYYYIDTLPRNSVKYVYRIQGITPFGEYGPYSDTASVIGIDRINALPEIISHKCVGPNVVIEWYYPEDQMKKINGFQVYRGESSKGSFIPVSSVLDKITRSFTDVDPIQTAYYKIKVFDKKNRSNYSLSVLMQLPDTIPPASPTGLQAKVDTSGRVILSWKSNLEEDIYGYRVYRANALHEEFSQLTVAPIRDTLFFDKVNLNTLTSKIYYKILANDKRQNYSLFSEILEVNRPDTIPPSPPVIQNIYASDSGVCINWINSSSSDIYKNFILRRAKDSINWMTINILGPDQSSYCDQSAIPGKIYSYSVITSDKYGNQSTIVNSYSAKLNTSSCLGIKNLDFKIDRDKNSVVLTWLKPVCASRYIIYRGSVSKPLTIYKTILDAEPRFEDAGLIPDTEYIYAVKAISETNISGVVESLNVKY